MLTTADFEEYKPQKPRTKKSRLQRQIEESYVGTEYEIVVPCIGKIFTIASKYSKTYNDPELYDEMVQSLLQKIPTIVNNHDPSTGPFENFFTRWVGMESRSVKRKWDKHKEHEQGVDDTLLVALSQTYEVDLIGNDEGRTKKLFDDLFSNLTQFEYWVVYNHFVEGLSYEKIRILWNKNRPDKKFVSKRVFHVNGQRAIRKLQERIQQLILEYSRGN